VASLKSPVEIEHVTGAVGQTARTVVPDVVGRSLLGDDVLTDRELTAPDDPADGAVTAHAGPSVKAPHESSQDRA
jgi:hypothetical protein